jgi:hypothetical protein
MLCNEASMKAQKENLFTSNQKNKMAKLISRAYHGSEFLFLGVYGYLSGALLY